MALASAMSVSVGAWGGDAVHDGVPAECRERHPQVVERRAATEQQVPALGIGRGNLTAPVSHEVHRLLADQQRHGWVLWTEGARFAS
jgi:hypothetical protein